MTRRSAVSSTVSTCGLRCELARRSMSSSRSNSSAWACIEMYSPAAIETAPATSPASPARRTNDAGAGFGAGDAEDQRHVRHQPVADPEHRGPGRAALDVAVVVLGVGSTSGTVGPVTGRIGGSSRSPMTRPTGDHGRPPLRRRTRSAATPARTRILSRAPPGRRPPHPLRPRPGRVRRAPATASPRYRVDQVWDGLYGQAPAARRAHRPCPKALRARLDGDLPLALDPGRTSR